MALENVSPKPSVLAHRFDERVLLVNERCPRATAELLDQLLDAIAVQLASRVA